MRKILHIDMDAFYASVEQHDCPGIRGKPVIVGGDPTRRGVVAACSYEARKFGIRSAMSSARAHRLCPQAIFVRPNFKRYQEVSEQIHEIFDSITPLVEPLSLDEAYLDVTQNSLNEPLAMKVAEQIKARIKVRTGLTASAGVGPNKFIAKVASDMRKPDGLMVVHPSQVEKFLETLPVEKLWGVGPKTAERLHLMNLKMISQIRERPLEEMVRALGKFGVFLHELSRGIDDRPVEPHREAKSRGAEETFERDVLDLLVLENCLGTQATEIADSLKEMDCLSRTVTLKLRYSDFSTITRSRTFFRPTDRASVIAGHATQLLNEVTEAGKRPVRLIGVSVSALLKRDDPQQLWLDLPDF